MCLTRTCVCSFHDLPRPRADLGIVQTTKARAAGSWGLLLSSPNTMEQLSSIADGDYALRMCCAWHCIQYRGTLQPDEIVDKVQPIFRKRPREQIQPVVQCILQQVHWGTLRDVFGAPLDADAIMAATPTTVRAGLHKFLASIARCTTPRPLQDRITHLKRAYNLFGRNHLDEPAARYVQTGDDSWDKCNPLRCASLLDVAGLKKELRDLRRGNAASSPGSPGSPPPRSKAERKKCPPMNVAFAAAMMVQLGRQLVAFLKSLEYEQPGPKACRTAINQSICLRDLHMTTVFGKRNESEVTDMPRYSAIYVLLGERRVPLRCLQRAGMDVCLQYLRAGFPVFFETHQGKSLKDSAPLTLGLTMKPDELSLLCPIVSTLLHYQLFDLVGDRAAQITTAGAKWLPDREYCVQSENHLSNAVKTHCHEHGLAREPVLDQLFGNAEERAEHLAHTRNAGRHSLQGSMFNLHCSSKVIGDVVGHCSAESQTWYIENALKARAAGGAMMPNQQATAFWAVSQQPDVHALPTNPLYLCCLRSVAPAAGMQPTCCRVSEELVAEVIGQQAVARIIQILSTWTPQADTPLSHAAPYQPPVPLRLDGLQDFGVLIHQQEEDGTLRDVTPQGTKDWLAAEMDALHRAQGVVTGPGTWKLPVTCLLLGASLRRIHASWVQLMPWGTGAHIDICFKERHVTPTTAVQLQQTVRSRLERSYRPYEAEARKAAARAEAQAAQPPPPKRARLEQRAAFFLKFDEWHAHATVEDGVLLGLANLERARRPATERQRGAAAAALAKQPLSQWTLLPQRPSHIIARHFWFV